MFQVFSRPNSPAGNPYRLIVEYDEHGNVVKMTECRSSSPNYVQALRDQPQLPGYHLAPAEYNEFKKIFKHLLEQGD